MLKKFELNYILFRYHIFQNKPTSKTITDANFHSLNPIDILTIVAHFQSVQSYNLNMGAYHSALSFLKDYVVEFCKCDYELPHMLKTDKLLAKIHFKLPEAEILAEGRIDEPVLGFVYDQRKTNQKDFFRVQDKYLVPIKALQKFITRASKSEAPEHVKEKFVSQLQWYIAVTEWLYSTYIFINEDSSWTHKIAKFT